MVRPANANGLLWEAAITVCSATHETEEAKATAMKPADNPMRMVATSGRRAAGAFHCIRGMQRLYDALLRGKSLRTINSEQKDIRRNDLEQPVEPGGESALIIRLAHAGDEKIRSGILEKITYRKPGIRAE